MSTATLPCPDLPKFPTMPTRPVHSVPKRNTLVTGLFGLLGGASAFFAFGFVVNVIGSRPGADFGDGVNAGMNGIIWALIVGFAVYFLLTIPYEIRDARALKAHHRAIDAYDAEVARLNAEYQAAVKTYDAAFARYQATKK